MGHTPEHTVKMLFFVCAACERCRMDVVKLLCSECPIELDC